ncbi:interleukin-36 receptor antagonist protein-like [Dermochelys coriacea]|uniref:interleukin-36 receptor antagonist protein-like n=1 Tax=Dermochelys coriacea TaxID=27794 RepID=UPI001CA9CB8D|nr:interleukin-36 receptor antagonist protein-like [Dermochelys coriacea]XP_043359068.1 interleukin-36 receptor antagonist protein-like [Dermochelys coriacea]XP_043359069.1 interleukin-36 receptor antagonist protein-like [Dermochelys coriacea]
MELVSESVVDPDMEELFRLFLDEAAEGGNGTFSTEIAKLPTPGFQPSKQPLHYWIRDTSHKAFYLRDNRLVAANLQGENASQEEKVSVVPNRGLERKKCPLILGIKGGRQGLSCGTAKQPRLQLEDMHLTELFYKYEEAKRFTFFKTYNGSTHRFEAAAYPGWFLCTSAKANEPISLTAHPGETAIIDFYFKRK